jgi:hypothetical protein
MRSVIGDHATGQKAIGWYHNLEISDLTLDANLREPGTNNPWRVSECIQMVGNNIQFRRIRAINAGTTIPGWEVMHIEMHSFGAKSEVVSNIIIEDCDIVQAQVGNAYKSGMLSISSYESEYESIIVRNCYIDGAGFIGNTRVDPSLYDVLDRGRFGVGIGGARRSVVEDNLIVNAGTGFYIDSVSLHELTVRSNHFRNVCFGFDLALISSGTSTNRLTDRFVFSGNFVELDPNYFPVRDTWGTLGNRLGFRLIGNLRGPSDFTFNEVVVENNLFQFTDKVSPQASVVAYAGSFQGVRAAVLRSNLFLGPFNTPTWENQSAYFARQADILDPIMPVPVEAVGNRRTNGTICEVYPYVLDESLLRPAVYAGEEVTLDAPLVGGLPAKVLTGLPVETIGADGKVRWRTAPQDAGVYVASFYDSTNRMADPRRTMITVLPKYPVSDARWFAGGLAGYWRLDEAEGGSLGDSSGGDRAINTTNAIKAGRASLGVEGISSGGRAVRLNGVSPQYGHAFGAGNSAPHLVTGLPRAHHPGLNASTQNFHPFTLSLWFKTEVQLEQSGALATFGGGFFCAVQPHKSDASLFAVRLGSWTGDVSLSTATNITAGVWHHLTILYDGVSARLHIDGQLAAEDSFGQLTGWLPNQTFWFGGSYGFTDFVGCLDEIAIWNRTLSGEEVSALYSMQLSGTEPIIQPLDPSSLGVETTYEGALRLTWFDDASNEIGYRIERSVDGGEFSPIAFIGRDANSFEDTPFDAGSYLYRVIATNSLASSGYATAPAPVLYYPVTNRITFVTNGLGAIKPLNFATNRLEIGAAYSVAATPGPGFVFTRWTDGLDAPLGTDPTLHFTMQPRLVLIAHFLDVERPGVRITSPPANSNTTNPVVAITGASGDNHKVTNVWVSVNSIYFQRAQTTNNWAAWNLGTRTLAAGTNIIRAYSSDASGASSQIATNKVFVSVKAPITLRTNGAGSLKKTFGALLEIGRAYSVTAVPAPGHVFSNWVGGATSSSASLPFIMRSNMVLQANFIPNPFKVAKGRYYGLFSQTTRAHDRSGFMSLSLTESGSYSGSIRIGPSSHPFSGKLDVSGKGTNSVSRKGTNALTLKLNVNLTPGADELSGTVGDGAWTASLLAHRAVFTSIANPARAFAGKYTVIVPGATTTALPQGDGYGAVSISASGALVFKGSLADDSPVTQSTFISKDGRWPLYLSLYAGSGSLYGWMNFDTNQPPSDLHGPVSWIKPPLPGAKYYPSGFNRSVLAEGSRFRPAAYAGMLLNMTNGVLRLEGGQLSSPLVLGVTLGKTGFASTNALTLTLQTASGLFSGKCALPGTTATNAIRGALFQNLNCGYGYFLGTNRSGSVTLSP